MASKNELDHALNIITKSHEDVSILHCVSEYPTHPDHLNLNTIRYLKKHYPQYGIGFSDHTIGISAPIVAVGMGAEIIEKHVTIDRGMKGTDQAGSLGPEGVKRMVRDIRIAERWIGREDFFIEPNVAKARIKLERSVAAKRDLSPGDIISENDIHLLSPGDGVKWIDRNELIGRTVIKSVPKNEIIYANNVKKN